MLFNKRLLQTHLNGFEYPQGFDFEHAEKIISNWQKAIKDGNYDKTRETQVQSSFLHYFFNIILGYKEMQDNSDEWFLINEAKTELDGTKADGALGYFTKDEKLNVTRAVIELKDAKTPLDKKQSSRKDYDSPVSQAFSYSSKFDRCDWIIVSNFKEIRLYNKDRGQGYFESFQILDLDDAKEFKRFYFLLCKENLLDKNRNSLLDKLVKDTSKNEEDISKQFYKDFKALRQELFVHFCEHNPSVDKKCLLEKTQKFLDRLVFIMFCEDSSVGLLPMNTLKSYYETGKNLPIPSDEKVYPIIRGLFHSIDKGNNDVKPPINKYNGGLFATDEILDNLTIKDSAWANVINLANYDFESDLNVNILGHIFEQSLSDLEQIKAEIEGIEQDKTKSKRKKDGIFYTPEYITRYIVEQTIGKYLDENPDKLETIKILDPACGSGAFLNQAHTFLKEQYQIRTEEKIDNERASKRGGQEFVALDLFKHTNIAETDRSILLNNIFGVDLNEESTEITKLALWLKTAKKDQPLQNLDNNIKCGNSLIDDATIAGDKAFNWYEQFPQIFPSRHSETVPAICGAGEESHNHSRHSELVSESHNQSNITQDVLDCHADKSARNDGSQDGFDCIIGNPPYGVSFSEKEKIYLSKFDENVPDYEIYIYFISKGLQLLNEGGILSYIFPNTFLSILYGKKYRKWILDNFEIISIVDLSNDDTFVDASVRTCIFTVMKKQKTQEVDFISINAEIKSFNVQNTASYDVLDSSIDNWLKLLEHNPITQNIIEKICANTQKLNELCEISQGYIPYRRSDLIKVYGEDEGNKIVDERKWHSEIKKNSEYIQEILGKDIGRYYNSESSSFFKYGKHVACYVNTKFFNQKRILIREIVNENLYSTIVEKEFLNNPSVIDVIKKDINTNLEYVLSLINSKLMAWYHINTSPKAKKGLFPKILINDVRNLPIAKATQEQQTSLANKAEQMIELNKQLHEGVKSALDLLQTFSPSPLEGEGRISERGTSSRNSGEGCKKTIKITKKLETFYTLGLHPFLEELEKQGVKLSLSQKEELINWYKQKSDTLTNIKNQIDTLDHAIDTEVYKLYNLSEDEIKIIEG